jgi:hypothetical protein
MSSPFRSSVAPPSSPPNLPSSPLFHPPVGSGQKARKPPTITPKRFSRFFTPRSSASRRTPSKRSRSARQLRDITQDAINTRGAVPRDQSAKRALFDDLPQFGEDENALPHSAPLPNASKRRRISASLLGSSPPRSSPCRPEPLDHASSKYHLDTLDPIDSTDDERLPSSPIRPQSYPDRIKRLHNLSISGRILQRAFGGIGAVGRGRRTDHCTGNVCEQDLTVSG